MGSKLTSLVELLLSCASHSVTLCLKSASLCSIIQFKNTPEGIYLGIIYLFVYTLSDTKSD